MDYPLLNLIGIRTHSPCCITAQKEYRLHLYKWMHEIQVFGHQAVDNPSHFIWWKPMEIIETKLSFCRCILYKHNRLLDKENHFICIEVLFCRSILYKHRKLYATGETLWRRCYASWQTTSLAGLVLADMIVEVSLASSSSSFWVGRTVAGLLSTRSLGPHALFLYLGGRGEQDLPFGLMAQSYCFLHYHQEIACTRNI